MYIDTHCHLEKSDYDDVTAIFQKIKDSSVKKIIINGVDFSSNVEVLENIFKYDFAYGAIGFHPTELNDFNDEYFSWLDEKLNNDKVVALGEIGLDYHYEDTNKEKQKYVFRRQLEIAQKHNLPVIVHSRDAIQDTYDILKEYNLKGSIHCFSGSLEMAKRFIELGYFIGVGGVVTYHNAKNLKKVVEEVPLEKILLETDSPYLTPEPYRQNKNDSSYIPLIAKTIADIKNISVEKVGEQTTNNACNLFDF